MTTTTAPVTSTDAAAGSPAGPGKPGRPALPARNFWLHTERYALLIAWLALVVSQARRPDAAQGPTQGSRRPLHD